MLPVVPPIEWTPLYATDSVSYGTLIYWALNRTGQCWVTALKRNYAKGGTESETRQKGNVGGKYCVELLSLKFLWRTAHLREQRGRGGLSGLILTWVYSLLHVAVLCRKIWMIMVELVKIWLLQDSHQDIHYKISVGGLYFPRWYIEMLHSMSSFESDPSSIWIKLQLLQLQHYHYWEICWLFSWLSCSL